MEKPNEGLNPDYVRCRIEQIECMWEACIKCNDRIYTGFFRKMTSEGPICYRCLKRLGIFETDTRGVREPHLRNVEYRQPKA